jgi:hypothetical protein
MVLWRTPQYHPPPFRGFTHPEKTEMCREIKRTGYDALRSIRNKIELGRAVLRHAIAGYSPIVSTATSDHEYPTILGSERENVDGVHRVELRVAHDPPWIPLPTLPAHALTRSEAWRKVDVYDTERAT